jgi:hypothetical protein
MLFFYPFAAQPNYSQKASKSNENALAKSKTWFIQMVAYKQILGCSHHALLHFHGVCLLRSWEALMNHIKSATCGRWVLT